MGVRRTNTLRVEYGSPAGVKPGEFCEVVHLGVDYDPLNTRISQMHSKHTRGQSELTRSSSLLC
jgi:hypothetical protein